MIELYWRGRKSEDDGEGRVRMMVWYERTALGS
jgi:hypothetical protein